MDIDFSKYQGTGNDFILLDNRSDKYSALSAQQIQRLCDRKFGIGADGLMFLNKSVQHDFKMIYFNADGHEGSMCGNGGRCIVDFAHKIMSAAKKEYLFEAVDGLHEAIIKDQFISLKMIDVMKPNQETLYWDTGSPHHVEFVKDLETINVFEKGQAIRYSPRYSQNGTNVNFVEILDETSISVKTYERGVEAETLSCGTGVTAAALAFDQTIQTNLSEVKIRTKGGGLKVSFDQDERKYFNIWLTGPATMVFQGNIKI